MSAWAYRCHPCVEGEADWFVSQLDGEKLGPDVQIVRVKVGADWKCALLDRTQTVAVENQLLRDVIASNEEDCPQCAEMLAARTSTVPAAATDSSPTPGGGPAVNSPTPEVSSPLTGEATSYEQLTGDERLSSLIVALEAIRVDTDKLAKKCRQATEQLRGNRPFGATESGERTARHGEMEQPTTAPSQNSTDASSDARRFAPESHAHSKGDYSYEQYAYFGPTANGSGVLDRFFSVVGLANYDLSEAAFTVMMAATKDMDDDIRMIMAEIKAMTKAKKKLRELIKDLNQWISEEMSKQPDAKDIANEEVTGESPDRKFRVSGTKIRYRDPLPDLGNEELVAEIATFYEVIGGRVTIQALQSFLCDFKGKLDGTNALTEQILGRLLIAVERRRGVVDLSYRILKAIAATTEVVLP